MSADNLSPLERFRLGVRSLFEKTNRAPTSAVCHPDDFKSIALELGAWPCDWVDLHTEVGVIRIDSDVDVRKGMVYTTNTIKPPSANDYSSNCVVIGCKTITSCERGPDGKRRCAGHDNTRGLGINREVEGVDGDGA